MVKSFKSADAGRRLYIAQAALEYLVALLFSGSFLATLTKELGFSDSLTGILSSIISLGCLFQIGAMFLRPRRIKPLVVGMSIVNQLLFTALYVLPLWGVDGPWKSMAAFTVIVMAYFTYYLVHPGKMNWLMSLVDDRRRGIFTARKEIVSLLSGMLFTFCMSAVTDHYMERGDSRTAFVITALVLVALTVLHTLCLTLTPAPTVEVKQDHNLRERIVQVLQDKQMRRIVVVFLLYQVAYGASIPFYGAYLIGDLGMSLTVVSLLTVVTSAARILASTSWGRYADRHSFAHLMEKCLWILAGAYLCAACAVPANGMFLFAGYYLLNGVAMGGINSAMTNLVFDYVPYDRRADSLAVCQALSGVVGFATTLCVSPLVSMVQGQGNRVLGVPLYAPQLLSILALAVSVLAVLYVRRTLIGKKK